MRCQFPGLGVPGSATSRDGVSRLTLLAPRDGATVISHSSAKLGWRLRGSAAYFRVDVHTVVRQPVEGVLLQRTILPYDLRTLASQSAAADWRRRVTALDGTGALLRRTPRRGLLGSTATAFAQCLR